MTFYLSSLVKTDSLGTRLHMFANSTNICRTEISDVFQWLEFFLHILNENENKIILMSVFCRHRNES